MLALWLLPAVVEFRIGRIVRARDFMDTFGVNVHLGQNGYANAQAVADALNVVGLRRIRVECSSASDVATVQDVATKVKRYFPEGMKADVLVKGYLNAPDATLASQKARILEIAPLVESVEGPNEINNVAVGNGTHGPDDLQDRTKAFAQNYGAWAKALATWKATPGFAKVELFAPTIASGDPADYAKLPDVSSLVDSGTFHFYAGNGRPPSGFGGGNFAAVHDWYKAAASPTKPVAVSEWGQTTAPKPGQGGCDEPTQAKYVLDQMMDIAAKGVHRAYLYQLMDDSPDGDPRGNGGAEAHFGIFDHRWRAKPAARALANLKSLLLDSRTDFAAKAPAYTVAGLTDAGAAGSSLAIVKSDGRAFVVVWNEPAIWDPKTNSAVRPSPNEVTVDFGGTYAYRVYDPLVGIHASDEGLGTRTKVELTGSPILIELKPNR